MPLIAAQPPIVVVAVGVKASGMGEGRNSGEEGEEGSQQKHPAKSYSVILHVPLLGLSYQRPIQVSSRTELCQSVGYIDKGHVLL